MEAPKSIHHPSQLSDSEIIRRILSSREKELYELLLRRNNQTLFRVIRSYMKNIGDIEDVMQNTYLKAYEKLDQFQHSSKFSTWLIKIGINEALAALQKRGKIRSIELGASQQQANATHIMRKQEHLSPERKVLQQEARQFIEKAIDQLDPKYKVVFMMKEVEGMSIQEVADCLDLSTSNVKVRLHRAKTMLQETLLELHLNKDVFEFGFNKCDNLVKRVMEKIG